MKNPLATSNPRIQNTIPEPNCGKGRTVLIGFGEALSALEVAWNLLDAGFRVAVFVRRGRLGAIRKVKNVKVIEVAAPENQAYQTVDQLLSAVKRVHAEAVLPLDDASVWVCEAASSDLSIPVAGSSATHARLALDKRVQLKAAAEAGFKVPQTQFIESTRDLRNIDSFPLIVKPALAIAEVDGKLYKGPMRVCADYRELEAFVRNLKEDIPMLAQRVLSGIGEGLFGLAGPSGVKKWSSHRRIRMMNPAGSGSSACSSLQITDQPLECAERMLNRVNWRGLFMIELLRDQSNQIWFMELNGRSWGSMALAIRRGFKYPVWAVAQALDSSFEPLSAPSNDQIVCRHLGREIVHILMVLRGGKSAVSTSQYSRLKTIFKVCRVHRYDRWYNWRPGNTPLFVKDTVDTVLGAILRRRSS